MIMALCAGSAYTTTCATKLMPMFQGNCISDYAVVATTAVELAWCLKDEAKYSDIKFSAQDLICRCKDCHTIKGNGCLGGDLKKALTYIKDGNAVGGSYGEQAVINKDIPVGGPTISNTENEGANARKYVDCLKYWTPICDPTVDTNCATAAFDPKNAAMCPTDCDRKTGNTIDKSKILGAIYEINEFKTGSSTSVEDSIKTSLTEGKPVVGTMEIFEDMDFYFGTNNIYTHRNGQSLGVVSIIFLTAAEENGIKFWDVLVPWDKKYNAATKISDQRLRVVRGVNHCNMETKAW